MDGRALDSIAAIAAAKIGMGTTLMMPCERRRESPRQYRMGQTFPMQKIQGRNQ